MAFRCISVHLFDQIDQNYKQYAETMKMLQCCALWCMLVRTRTHTNKMQIESNRIKAGLAGTRQIRAHVCCINCSIVGELSNMNATFWYSLRDAMVLFQDHWFPRLRHVHVFPTETWVISVQFLISHNLISFLEFQRGFFVNVPATTFSYSSFGLIHVCNLLVQQYGVQLLIVGFIVAKPREHLIASFLCRVSFTV